MKKHLIILSSIALLGFATACNDHKPVKGGEHIEQTIMLYNVDGATHSKASTFKANAISLTAGDGIMSVEKNFSLGLLKPADKDLELKVRVSPIKAKEYMMATNTKFELLNEELIELPKTIKLEKGSMMSEVATLNVKIDESKIKENVDYIFAITLGSEGQEIKLSEVNNSLIYTLKLSPAGKVEIRKVLRMERENYLSLEKVFTSNPASATIETFINVEKFRTAADPGDAEISSFWGVEGRGLFRFGDSGLPGNKLQAYGQGLNNFEFQENRWYHVAAVFEKGSMTVYVDGKQIAKINGKTPVIKHFSGWFIGRSYNDNRGIQAKFSEFRIWNVARTLDQINESMFGVDPTTSGLLAYWKMDKAEGNKIKDMTSNGHNLIHKSQPGDRAVNCEIAELKSPIELVE